MENEPSYLFDALVLGDGEAAVASLSADARTIDYIKDQYRHCKPILALGAAQFLLEQANIPAKLPTGKEDPGLILGGAGKNGKMLADFMEAVAQHRHFQRESDPPRV